MGDAEAEDGGWIAVWVIIVVHSSSCAALGGERNDRLEYIIMVCCLSNG